MMLQLVYQHLSTTTQAPIMLQCSSVLYSEGLAPKNPMLPSGGTLDNVTKTIGRLLDGYDIRLRPNFGGELCYNYHHYRAFYHSFSCSGDPLYVGFDLTIASFDSISEVSMVSILAQYANTSAYISFPHKYYT